MNIEEIREHCLSLPDVTEDSAFGPEMILFRLKGKIFAALDLDRPDLMVVKCDPDEGTDLRDRYAGIRPAWHWNTQHWVEILFDEDVDDQMIRNLATRAYHLVRTALPKKTLYHFPHCGGRVEVFRYEIHGGYLNVKIILKLRYQREKRQRVQTAVVDEMAFIFVIV